MNDLNPCGMCGAPWAQMCQENDEKIARLQAKHEALEAAAREVVEAGNGPFSDPIYQAIDHLAAAIGDTTTEETT